VYGEGEAPAEPQHKPLAGLARNFPKGPRDTAMTKAAMFRVMQKINRLLLVVLLISGCASQTRPATSPTPAVEVRHRDRCATIEKSQRELNRRRGEYVLNRAISHFLRREFDKSDCLALEVLRIEPLNKIAQRLHEDSLKCSMDLAEDRFISSRVERWGSIQQILRDLRTVYVCVWPAPKRWKSVSRRKRNGELTIALDDSEALKKIERELEQQRITLDFDETPFIEVVQSIAQISQLSIVIDQAARKQLARAGDLVTLHVKELRLKDALTILVKLHGLSCAFYKDGLLITVADR